MDSISNLPDDLLLTILSSVPTKDVMGTMLVSKRWKPVWKSVSRLVYDDINLDTEAHTFARYVHRSLSLHKAPVLDKLSFKLSPRFTPVDIATWIDLGVTRCLRKLHILLSGKWLPIRLPESLYTCKTLECLKLSGGVLVEVFDPVCLPSLFRLYLLEVTYSDKESFHRLLSGCPILECLIVEQTKGDNLPSFQVKVPSLGTLRIGRYSDELSQDINQGIVIDAPSLTWLSITDYSKGFCLIGNTPMLEIAGFDMAEKSSEKFKRSFTSVMHLDLCVSIPKMQPVYPKGIVFFRLEKLELCTCTEGWMDLLMSVLLTSPQLQILILRLYTGHEPNIEGPVWNQPSSVPRWFLYTLKTIEWSNYNGSEEEEKLVKFLLRYGSSLNTVNISSN